MRNNREGATGGRQNGFDAQRENETFTPMLISWLLSVARRTPDDVLKCDNRALDKIVLCGRKIRYSADGTKSLFQIEDGTGTIELSCNKKWDEKVPRVLEKVDIDAKNVYLKVIIEPGYYEGRRFFTVIKVQQIKDMNYLTFHFMDALYARKGRTVGYSNVLSKPSALETGQMDRTDHFDARGYGMGFEHDYTRLVLTHMRNLRIKHKQSVSLSTLIVDLGNKISAPEIQVILKQLVEAGEVRRIPGIDNTYDVYH